MSPEAPSAPRSLAEALRARDDASLAALLRSRPDLITPVPTDLTQLATRAGTRASVLRALERLDRFALQTAEALAVAPDPASYRTLLGLMAGDAGDETIAEALPLAVGVLREQALVWGDDDRLRLVRTARELLAPSPQHPSPTGLGPSVQEATSGMSPGRIQEIVATAGLPSTHDSVSAVAALTALFTDRKKMAGLLSGAPEGSREVLSRLMWGPPYGQVTPDPATHLRWLLDRGLLLPTTPGTVVLPREVALHLREGRAHRAPEPLPPAVEPAATRDPQVVDATAAGQAYTALATIEELLKEWDEGGPTVLRAGGLSVRDLKRTAVALDVPETVAAFWTELAHAAGLLASDGEADERYAATPAYDDWLERPAAERWARLAEAWLAATRTPGLVGGRDAKDRALSALGPGLDRSSAPEVRHRVLTLLAGLEGGAAPDTESVLARLRWERPLRGATGTASRERGRAPEGDDDADLRTRLARWTLSEAELLGITGRGALSAHGRALLGPPVPHTDSPGPVPSATFSAGSPGPGAPAGSPVPSAARPRLAPAGSPQPSGPGDKLPVRHRRTPVSHASLSSAERSRAAADAVRLLAPLLPEPVDHVLLQADLTAVAPGPLQRPLADALGVLADVESKGGATVYRFTPASVRRALDAGQTAADLHAFLTEHSRTPVPQPLAYLIDDVARKHGHLRVGAASAYVRCDDDTLLNEILADRRAAALRLRRLAPTVLAAPCDPATLLEGLRAMGYAPAAESAEGDVLVTRAHAHRTPPRTAPEPVPDGPPPPDATLLTAAIRAIRAGDLAATAPRKSTGTAPTGGELPRTSSAETLATMQAAVLTHESLWIGYVNAEGAASQRVIAPVRVEGGFVTAYDHTADEVRTYPLHRITGVAELADE
ncbi:DNA-binding protein [Streptomyces pluripotens]|uniref:DNA-binding protein n=1 Tax=Streptomyces pluripotens TaxID=1355015 RepID=A0A221P177_9ACTN|nr:MULTISPECIES: helicase C-terminal domain-containing protein [Streptomyces]ARP71584.1 DNA-binding protein [Streptomyces pluripotens]ASN25836.1 DNA-binding protein [Streptomyces pluripotens]KIE22935.1 DNA-binding protein [Streptomyces sp. MUSC 125]MCH0557508.1 helicase-associated domain-containing protein [Streptomyces sp. MUM 16J]